MMCRAMARAIVLVMMGLPTAASAQGSIGGTVTDASRRALPGVTVIVFAAPPAGPARQAVTDRSGRFVVADLDPSRTYAVGFLLPGFEPEWRMDVSASAGAPGLEVSLRAGARAGTGIAPLPQLDLPGPRLMPPGPGRECLHDTRESDAEADRRIEALRAMRLIAYAVSTTAGRGRHARFPSWAALAASPVVESLRNGSGTAAELARRIAWGSGEPLPGWRLSYAVTVADVRFALTDERDPCGFTYASTDPQVIPPTARVLPLM